MTHAARLALGGAALLLFTLPVAGACVLLSRDVREAPLKVTVKADARPREPIGPLTSGARHVLRLPESVEPIGGLLIHPATYLTRPRVRFEVCAGERCEASETVVVDNEPLLLKLPPDVHGGEVALVVSSLHDGALAYWGREGQPLFQPLSERSWTRPLARARGYFEVAVGAGSFAWVLGLNGVLTGALFVLACWRAWRGPRRALPVERSARPDVRQKS
ncbi:hypothetical protein [Pyxidicoccus xibeiensis]|uniref:hypothetical protein n=1 Tax=Pyxidicoccus xibeiensis TaxID=2906759 RepID=UPI0020A7CFDD|nr:hypothetical protein [Pyxidicoccus xibeiensis]MCP3138241.1 hypothetical protein [Pyxidicoccus xibeiensis]